MTGCATTTVNLAEGPREYVATDYETVLRRWTRTEQLIALAELDNFLTATATFESWDFRWAYVVRLRAGLPPHDTISGRKLLEKTLEETRLRHEFFVAIYGGGPEVQRPYEVEQRLDRPLDRRHRKRDRARRDHRGHEAERDRAELFPVQHDLQAGVPHPVSARRRRWPAHRFSPNAKWFGLRFAGAQGNSELVWEIGAANATKTARREGEPRVQ